MFEEWAPVPGYEDLYLISNLGKVYNYKLKRIIKSDIKHHHANVCKNHVVKSIDLYILCDKLFEKHIYSNLTFGAIPPIKGEIWKDVKHYEGKYRVSDYARVYDCIHHRLVTWQCTGWNYCVAFTDGKTFRIEELVANAFLGRVDEPIFHKDLDLSNNVPSNLSLSFEPFNEDEWAPVKGHLDYMVSSSGLVYSLPRYITIRGRQRKIGDKLLTLWHDDAGYAQVSLEDGGYSLHRVVAEAFIPNPFNLPEVNHKDGDKDNNSVSNLEWVTHTDNMAHSMVSGLRDNFVWNHPKTVSTYCPQLDIYFLSMKSIARYFNCDPESARHTVRGHYVTEALRGYSFIEVTRSEIDLDKLIK